MLKDVMDRQVLNALLVLFRPFFRFCFVSSVFRFPIFFSNRYFLFAQKKKEEEKRKKHTQTNQSKSKMCPLIMLNEMTHLKCDLLN